MSIYNETKSLLRWHSICKCIYTAQCNIFIEFNMNEMEKVRMYCSDLFEKCEIEKINVHIWNVFISNYKIASEV